MLKRILMDMQQQIDELKRDIEALQVIVAAILVESMGQDDEETSSSLCRTTPPSSREGGVSLWRLSPDTDRRARILLFRGNFSD